MKKIMVFGAFDGFHPGHLRFFKEAKKYGDFLIVSLGLDENVKKIKGKAPLFSQSERLELIKSLKIVNKAILGDPKNYFNHIKKESPDVICLGYDQWASEKYVRKELERVGLKNTKVIRIKGFKPEKFKSTFLKKELNLR